MRVYFYNPNNDSGQDWGDGVVVGTACIGERFGEGSLPFKQFASRLYIYHYDPFERGDAERVPAEDLQRVVGYIERSGAPTGFPPGAAGRAGAVGCTVAESLRRARSTTHTGADCEILLPRPPGTPATTTRRLSEDPRECPTL